MNLSTRVRTHLALLPNFTFLWTVLSVSLAIILRIFNPAYGIGKRIAGCAFLTPFIITPDGASFRFIFQITISSSFILLFESLLYRDRPSSAMFVCIWKSILLHLGLRLVGSEYAYMLGVPLSFSLVYTILRQFPGRTIPLYGVHFPIAMGVGIIAALDLLIYGATAIPPLVAAVLVGHVLLHARFGDPDPRWEFLWEGFPAFHSAYDAYVAPLITKVRRALGVSIEVQ